MWRALSLIEGSWQEIEPIVVEPQLPSSSLIAAAIQSRYPNDELLRYVRTEAEHTQTSRDAIQLWARQAEEANAEFGWRSSAKLEALDETLSYYPTWIEGDSDMRPATLAWHDATAVILRLNGSEDEVVLEYTPSYRDQNRVERLRHLHAGSSHKLETILDWRGYFGATSAIIDGWNEFLTQGGRLITRVRARNGFLVGYVLRRLTGDQPTLQTDATMQGRLVDMCDRHWKIAQRFPDISFISQSQHDRAIVFVHGTVSCGIQCLKDWPEFPEPAFRFEHDTFLRIRDNGEELANTIRQKLETKELLLIGHSRGGLVARIAAQKLVKDGYAGDTHVWTFGTPHIGTPLVSIGGKCLNLLYKVGEEIVGGIPKLSLITKAFSYLVDSPVLPPGIEVMRHNSEILGELNGSGDSKQVTSWGSQFDIDQGPSGFGIEIENVLLGAMGKSPHDLIVPLSSATAFGTVHKALACAHSNYFQVQEVKDKIINWAGARAAAAAVASNPQGGQVTQTPGYVTFGGVRIRRRP